MADLKQNTVGLFTGLPIWAKGVIAIAVTGTLVFVGYKVYKKLNVSEQEKEEKERNEEKSSEQKKEENKNAKKVTPTFKESQYISFADILFNYYNGCVVDPQSWLEKYTKAANILMSMKNDLDISKLINSYGTRQRTCAGFNIKGKDDLLTTIQSALSNPIFNKMKKNINNNWANKFITYRIE
jgi:hypothetical protein